MANPFPARFRSGCDECGRIIEAGDELYVDDNAFICKACAKDADIVCPKCGHYKKPEYETCYNCHEHRHDEID